MTIKDIKQEELVWWLHEKAPSHYDQQIIQDVVFKRWCEALAAYEQTFKIATNKTQQLRALLRPYARLHEYVLPKDVLQRHKDLLEQEGRAWENVDAMRNNLEVAYESTLELYAYQSSKAKGLPPTKESAQVLEQTNAMAAQQIEIAQKYGEILKQYTAAIEERNSETRVCIDAIRARINQMKTELNCLPWYKRIFWKPA